MIFEEEKKEPKMKEYEGEDLSKIYPENLFFEMLMYCDAPTAFKVCATNKYWLDLLKKHKNSLFKITCMKIFDRNQGTKSYLD